MLIFTRQNLAYLAVPKTGTTAIETTLRRHADILFAKNRKHMPARAFHRNVAPFLKTAYDLVPDRVAVMRDPIAQLSSWYRYRSGDRLHGSPKSTAGISFDQFILDVISDTPPPHADVGGQFKFLSGPQGKILVHHLFAYEHMAQFHDFLEARFDEPLEFKTQNVSPKIEVEIESKTHAKLRAARATEFDLYDRLIDAGGVLNFTFDGS